MPKRKEISSGEICVLETLWKAGKPLSQPEILEQIPHDMFNNRTTAYSMINKLLKKNLIKMDGVVQVTKGFMRLFSPTITKRQFTLHTYGVYNNDFKYNLQAATDLASYLCYDENAPDVLLDTIEAMIAKRRKEKKQ